MRAMKCCLGLMLLSVTTVVYCSLNISYAQSAEECETQELLAVEDCLFLSDLVEDNDIESLFGSVSASWCGSEYVMCQGGFIEQLSLQNLDLNSFDRNGISSLGGLKHLAVSGSPSIFSRNIKIVSDSLTELLLEENDLADIDWMIAVETPNLTLLSLMGNDLEDISLQTFANFSSLTSLDISHNTLRSVVFLSPLAERVESLDISHNRLSDMSSFVGLDFQELLSLELSYNSLINITDLEDVSFPKLRYFFLNNNAIVDFSPLFDGAHDYYFVRIQDNTYRGYFPVGLDDDFSYEVGRIGLELFQGNEICGRFPQEFIDVLNQYPVLTFVHDYTPKAIADIDFLPCGVGATCLADADCESGSCEDGLCAAVVSTSGASPDQIAQREREKQLLQERKSEQQEQENERIVVVPEQVDALIERNDSFAEQNALGDTAPDLGVEMVGDSSRAPVSDDVSSPAPVDTVVAVAAGADVRGDEEIVVPVDTSSVPTSPSVNRSRVPSRPVPQGIVGEESGNEAQEGDQQEQDIQEEEVEIVIPEGAAGSYYWSSVYLYTYGVLRPLTAEDVVVLLLQWSGPGLLETDGVITPSYTRFINPGCLQVDELSLDLSPSQIASQAYSCIGGKRSFDFYYSHYMIGDFIKQFRLAVPLS